MHLCGDSGTICLQVGGEAGLLMILTNTVSCKADRCGSD